jgi:type IV pilus assembly protein PilN
MMIRINLLPVRQVKKRELGRQFLVVAVGLTVIALIGNWFWYGQEASKRDKAQQRVEETKRRITELDKVIGEVKNINAHRKEVNDKLDVLKKLRKGRSGPVKMLDALAMATPKKVWVTEFEEKALAVTMKGRAISNEDVADFMRGLSSMVWTAKGMARVVERKRGEDRVRVELLAQEGAMEDFAPNEVAPFFTNIDLKRTESKGDSSPGSTARQVSFEIGMTVNYAT